MELGGLPRERHEKKKTRIKLVKARQGCERE